MHFLLARPFCSVLLSAINPSGATGNDGPGERRGGDEPRDQGVRRRLLLPRPQV